MNESTCKPIVQAIGEAIQALGEVPSGHLYARVMNYLTLAEYTTILDRLKSMKLIEEKHHLLRWIGPKS